jgi:hypothetical protein
MELQGITYKGLQMYNGMEVDLVRGEKSYFGVLIIDPDSERPFVRVGVRSPELKGDKIVDEGSVVSLPYEGGKKDYVVMSR